MQRADEVRFVAEEDGWRLHVTDEDGATHVFLIHSLAWDLAEHARETIGAWRAEGEAARRTMPASAAQDLTALDQEIKAPGDLNLERLRDSGALDVAIDSRRGK